MYFVTGHACAPDDFKQLFQNLNVVLYCRVAGFAIDNFQSHLRKLFRLAGTARLIAKRRALIAQARFVKAAGAHIIQHARYGQVGAQAQFFAAGVGEAVQAALHFRAHAIDERVAGLQNRGFDLPIARRDQIFQKAIRRCNR